MKKKTSILSTAFCILLMFTLTGVIQAQTIELKKLALDNRDHKLQLHFGFSPQEFDEFQELLEDGVPLKLICKASLLRMVSFWPDKLVSQKEASFELKADTLSQEYILTDLKGKQSMQNKELQSLLQSNLGELAVTLGDWESLVQGQEYVLELEIRLTRDDFPAWLRTAMFFWSGHVLKNKKYKMKFTY
ncbi:MAG: DUF4390 domain-containing protein [Desulfohalobiaceae bacterium]|nr:DUF4390 domain-containing protein [Desulfohalobiaceae bacterium]